MENENNRGFDYSQLYNTSSTGSSGENGTGYVNVGSSGTNTANTADEKDSFAWTKSSSGTAATAQSAYNNFSQNSPKEKRNFRILRAVVALVLAAAMGFAGGFVGGRVGGGNKVIVQTVTRDYPTDETLPAVGQTSTVGDVMTLPAVSAAVSPSVVVITTEQVVYSSWSWYGRSQVQSGAGSGVILSEDGYILTCAHVVSDASNITVTIGENKYNATVVGADTEGDIAVLKIDATGLTPAVIGDSDNLAVGESVIAVGNPLGVYDGTVTDGIISALNRNAVVENKQMTLIQTNASISPGNSGGGLFNMAGELIGIVNAKSGGSNAEGLGFAIPSNTAMQIAKELMENGYVTGRPAMGVSVYTVTDASTARQLGVSSLGVYIVDVNKGSAAEKAGLAVGDRIVSIDNAEVTTGTDVTGVIGKHSVGDTIHIVVARNGQMMEFDLVLGEKNAPQTTKQQDETQQDETPFRNGLGR